jgi:hypothetical protein
MGGRQTRKRPKSLSSREAEKQRSRAHGTARRIAWLPGELLRSRITQARCSKTYRELVAESEHDHIEKAVRLGTDLDCRHSARDAILAGATCSTATIARSANLEDFFEASQPTIVDVRAARRFRVGAGRHRRRARWSRDRSRSR